MNILVISWNFPPRIGGIENVIYNLWKGLRARHNLCLITAYNRNAEEDKNIFRPFVPGLPAFFIFALIKGAFLVCFRKIDLIFCGSGLTVSTCVILGKLFRKRVAVNVYGLDIIHPNVLYQLLLNMFLSKCNSIITISGYSKKLLLEKGIPASNIRIISPGVDAERFILEIPKEKLKEKYNLSGKKVLLSVGRLAKRKGLAEFVERSLPRIAREAPETVFLIAGENPVDSLAHKEDTLSNIKDKISRYGLERNVRFLGKVDDKSLVEIYNLSDIFVLPAINVKKDIEGFGIVLIEAASAGSICVAAKTGGIPDTIENGKSGFLIECGDYEGLSDTILDLLNNPGKMNAISVYARERAGKTFDWKIILGKYEELFNGLVTSVVSDENIVC